MINVKKYNDRIDVGESKILEGIKFILSHFEKQHKFFPRTIKTINTKDQVKVEYELHIQNSINKILNMFKESNYYDCKINCFPNNNNDQPQQQQQQSIDNNLIDVKNKTLSSFIMIDLDLQYFSYDKKKLENVLNMTLNKLSIKFYGESNPTVLWTGNGYQIYQPLEGTIFENNRVFYDLLPYTDMGDLTTEFLRFAEKFFTNGNIESTKLHSVKSCFITVPGTFNFKNGEQVKIIHKWDGKSPSIQWIAYDFKNYLVQKKIEKIHERKKEIEKMTKSKGLKTDSNSNGNFR